MTAGLRNARGTDQYVETFISSIRPVTVKTTRSQMLVTGANLQKIYVTLTQHNIGLTGR